MTNTEITRDATDLLLGLVPGQTMTFQEMLPAQRRAARELHRLGLTFLDELVLFSGRFAPTDIGLTETGEEVRRAVLRAARSELGSILRDLDVAHQESRV